MITLTCMIVLPTLAHAHGAMGPDELGPPLSTAGLLGFVSYWVVMLWPARKKKTNSQPMSNTQYHDTASPGGRPHKRKNPRVKRIPHLRKVGASGQIASDQPERRKASDG